MLKTINDSKLPTRASKYSAFVDLYANEDIVIGAGETLKVGLGVCVDLEYLHKNVDIWCGHPYSLPKDGIDTKDDKYNKHIINMHNRNFEWYMSHHYLQLEPRSSLRAKGLIAGSGIIDLDYKDEIKIIIHNPLVIHSERSSDTSGYVECDNNYIIKKDDKIAQITLMEHKSYLLNIESDTERTGGIGSTGTK